MLTLIIHKVKNEEDYKEAMSRIDAILAQNPEPGTDLFDELELLSTLVHAYEEIHYPIDTPDPIEAIKYVMEEKGWKNKDLEPFIGPKSRVSEILNRKRYFTLEQINNLHKELNIPLEVFINDKVLEATVNH
ncbi:helix-turn-helix domain-containing protein [Adhaeribacter rhizoryzae]|uniref:Transcriptional regulator n=1 Tax=Adhaeribacter rhizoryzae TaxID=2607907 RepID=A0A5M6CV20_9BACT|nr:hypothetical protein [Adhaeribacter rhizoryzae]KAA5539041.1 hypothetical protein F0145_25215 [Adhaeribacter rhizoryzae]